MKDKSDTTLAQLARWASGLQIDQVPLSVREHAINQVLSILAAVYYGWESDLGPRLQQAYPSPGPGEARILPTGETAPASHAAMLMASWSMVLDFDDVMLGGHTGHSSVLVPLALCSAGRRRGSELLLAQIVANEIAARINMVCAVGNTRGQMATHLHLLAAAAARAKLEGLDSEHFAAVLSFAISYPGQALYPAFLGSDAKSLCAAFPVRAGMEAVDAVKAGLVPATDPLDGRRGFFSSTARIPVREFLGGLGERWHTATNSYKIYPVCGYLCSALDATLDLVRTHDIRPDDIESVDVWASLFTIGMDYHTAPYLSGPASCLSTLTFSTPFTVASAILARQFGPAQLKNSWIKDRRVWEMMKRIKSRHDVDLSLQSMTADIPIGAALRRTNRLQAAAFGWSAAAMAFGRTRRWRNPGTYRLMAGLAKAAKDRRPLEFEHSTKPMGARVSIRRKDGMVLQRSISIPRGFAGATMAHTGGRTARDFMREKFMHAAGNVIGAGQASKVLALIEDLEHLTPASLARLFTLACQPMADSKGAMVHTDFTPSGTQEPAAPLQQASPHA
jgi:2-methylcitrate dehydratase PrpD